MRITASILSLIASLSAVHAIASSFTADAVQIRDGEFRHARLFWTEGSVRFDYLENGVPMAQVYDIKNNRIIWLDTQNKHFIEQTMPPGHVVDPLVSANDGIIDPCEGRDEVECVRLKEIELDGRKAVKWLLTSTHDGIDFHTFQWIDVKHGIIIRQEGHDGSLLEVNIIDDQEIDGRSVRKLDIFTSIDGHRRFGTQWYDDELGIVVRQYYDNGSEDQLRNIRVEQLDPGLFDVPADFTAYEEQTYPLAPDDPTAEGIQQSAADAGSHPTRSRETR